MSRAAIRRTMWLGLLALYGVAATTIGTLRVSNDTLHPTPVLLVIAVLALLTCTAAVLHTLIAGQDRQEKILGVLEDIRGSLPEADAIAAQALLRGHELALTEAEEAASLPRLSDRRR